MDTLESPPVPECVDPHDWTLDVTGAVAEPCHLTDDDLRALPDGEVTEDFSCVEGWRAQNLRWHGVPVATVLSHAAPTAAASHVLVHAMDGDYASAFAIERIRAALLALALDDDPLPLDHGGPARLVPAGEAADCWESVKWVSELEVLEAEPTARDTARERALARVSDS